MSLTAAEAEIAAETKRTDEDLDHASSDRDSIGEHGIEELHAGGGGDLEKTATLTRTESEAYSVFTVAQKWWIVTLIAVASFFSPLSATIYFPALSSLSKQLHVTTELINLTITSYMIFQAIAPTFFGELADGLGRRPVYIILFTIYLGANIALALQRSYAALLVLRMLQSTGSSGVIALANGVVADISHAGERGMYMGIVNIGAMTGPAIGPIVGGILDHELGWWWIFWLLVIMAGTFLTIVILVFPETGRKVVGNGSIPAQGINKSVLQLMRGQPKEQQQQCQTERFQRPPLRFPNPLVSVMLLFQKDMAIVLFTNSIFYTAFYTVMASLPTVYAEIYGFNPLQVGLCYIPLGVGSALSGVVTGKIIDRDYRIVAKQCGITMNRRKGDDMSKFPIERARLRSIFWMAGVYVAVLICYGWVLHSLAAPLVLTFIVGAFGTGLFTILSSLIVDLYPTKPSSATACNNLVRCLMGAGGTAVIESMLNAMGRGWCFTFVGLVCLLMSPILLVERRHGMKWRLARLERERRS
ncbi:major facilitator superfamily domain-containing protein [Sphaerosporella brunnea]|uniref:Major facilitator superfamily domain-containing protein n=1 Tax=Sphaerosporella brunnea TaxID=1250544 RepID=A0A5J5F9L6_9PEZI|nr:major facilitator superfamily domain-containing protein [Sphaerosporella brunnea]